MIKLIVLFLISFGFMNRSTLEARLYFMHIQKTAGTTLRLLLEQQVSAQEIYPHRNRYIARSPVNHELISGHIPYWFCKRLDPDFEQSFKVTILRHPVERYLSFLRFRLKSNKKFTSLESVLNERFGNDPRMKASLERNALCRNLADDPNLSGEALLENAKQNLQKFDCVLFFENFSADVVDLFHRLGIELDENEIPRANVSIKYPVSEELLQTVTELNTLDLQLYEFAKTHLEKKTTTYPLRKSSFLKVRSKSNHIDYTFDQPLDGTGWNYRETDRNMPQEFSVYRWVTDQPARIYFSLEEGRDYHLYVNAQLVVKEIVPRVRINGRELELEQLDSAKFSLYHGIIPRDWISKGPAELTFFSPFSFEFSEVRPKENNRNYPLLAFALNRIQIRPL